MFRNGSEDNCNKVLRETLQGAIGELVYSHPWCVRISELESVKFIHSVD